MKTSTMAGVVFMALIVLGIVAVIHAYWTTVYAIDRSRGWLGRAQTAGTPTEFVTYMRESLKLLEPFHGNPVWWLPTEYTNVDRIKTDMESSIKRAEVLSELSPQSDAYQQGMDDLRGKVNIFDDQLVQIKDWLFFYNPLNLTLLAIWVVMEILLFVIWSGD